jgi:O-antigen ligase
MQRQSVLNIDTATAPVSVQERTATAEIPRWISVSLWFLMAISCVVYIEPSPYDLLIVVLFAIVLLASSRKKYRFQGAPVGMLWFFLACNIVSMFFADSFPQALKFFMVTAYLIVSWMFFSIILSRFGQKALDVMFSGYTVAALFSATIGTFAFLKLIPYYDYLTKYGRASGLFKDPNVFGPFLVPVAVYAIMRMSEKGVFNRAFWVSTFAVISIGVFASFSRASWGNYVLTIFLYLIISSKGNLKRIGAIFLLIVLASSALFILIASTPELSDMFEARFKLQGYDQDRFGTHEAALNAALENPLGIGPGQSEDYFNYATHNVYLRVLAENGLLGFIGYFGFLMITLFQSAYRSLRTRGDLGNYFALATATLVGILVNSLVIDSLHWRHLWFLAAIPWMLKVNTQSSEQVENEPLGQVELPAALRDAS